MRRRTLLQGVLAGLVTGTAVGRTRAAVNAVARNPGELQRNWQAMAPAGVRVPSPADKLSLTDAEWRRRLAPARYLVLREQGTERAGTSPLNEEHRPGLFVCAGCGLPVFTSEMKYDSGTGWPSFFTTIPGVFETRKDYLLLLPRIEYHCARCGGHHGHVFDDGPQPTRQRWCNNGVALRFLPKNG
jgi:peptide-methionine (R)-S-oxide reductase